MLLCSHVVNLYYLAHTVLLHIPIVGCFSKGGRHLNNTRIYRDYYGSDM